MRIEHPRAAADGVNPPSRVDVAGHDVTVDDDGWLELPEGTPASWVETFAAVHDVTFDEDGAVVREDSTEDDADAEAETCQEVTGDGDVCGRELPCQYHSDQED